jgi:hypothetical protein
VKPGELTRIEDTLRRAYGDVLVAVQREDTWPEVPLALPPGRPPRGAGRPGGRRRWLAPAAAAAAVAVVALVAGLVVPNEVRHTPPRPAAMGPMMAYAVGGESSLRGPDLVVPVNLATGGVLPPISLGEAGIPSGVLMAPNGKTIYVVTDGGDVVPVDTATRTAGPPIHIGGEPYGLLMSPDGHTGYFMQQYQGVATVNFVTDRPGPFIKIPDAFTFALTPNGKILYVVTGNGSVTPIDTATLQTLPPIMTGESTNMSSARIAVAPDGKMAYVLGLATGYKQVLTPIDTATETALPPISIPASALGTPITISPDSRSAYLYTNSGIMAINLTARTVSWTATLGGPIWSGQVVESPPWDPQTVVSPNGLTVYTHGGYASGGYNKAIFRINAATGTQLTPIRMGWPDPSTIGFGPDGKLYALSSSAAGAQFPAISALWELTSFDPATGAVSAPISLPETTGPSFYDLILGG